LKLDPKFLAYLQAAVYWPRTTVTKMIEEGAAMRLEQPEEKHNGGE
jgi:hypothetical protein